MSKNIKAIGTAIVVLVGSVYGAISAKDGCKKAPIEEPVPDGSVQKDAETDSE